MKKNNKGKKLLLIFKKYEWTIDRHTNRQTDRQKSERENTESLGVSTRSNPEVRHWRFLLKKSKLNNFPETMKLHAWGRNLIKSETTLCTMDMPVYNLLWLSLLNTFSVYHILCRKIICKRCSWKKPLFKTVIKEHAQLH
jgi:hypothetical protein